MAPLKSEIQNGGSAAAYITSIGVLCMDNIGVLGGRSHSIEEYGVISSLAQLAKNMAAIIVGFD